MSITDFVFEESVDKADMKYKQIKVHWETEELDSYYRKNHYPEKVWKDNEGMPFGIYPDRNRRR